MMQVHSDQNSTTLARAQGCLLGQLTGDALGSLVEFQSPEEIRRSYPEGVRELDTNGGTWNTIAGVTPPMIIGRWANIMIRARSE